MLNLKAFFPYPLIALLFGVGLASVGGREYALSMFVLTLALACAIASVFYPRRVFFYAAIVCLFLSFGMERYVYWLETPRSQQMENKIEQRGTFTGVVDDEPDIRETNTHVTLLVHEADGAKIGSSTLSRVLVFAPRYPEYVYGDVLSVEGKLVLPKKFAEDGGVVFDYPMYLASKGIRYQIFFPNISLIEREKGNIILTTLYRAKHNFQEKLSSLFPEPHGALLGGLLLGGKQSLGSEWQDTFQRAGIIHIVVLSGYNMTVVSEWLVILFRFLGFYGSLGMGGFGIVLFALMTGAGATVVRAAIMAIIALLARATGHHYVMARALLLAGVCMVVHNPSILSYNPSFQLSFLASLGLILVSPIVEYRTKIFRKYKIVREVFVSTVATQLMVLPLLLYQTGMFSLVSLPANMLVLPAIPMTMLLGFISGLVSYVVPALSPVVALPAHALLSWILFIAEMGGQVPLVELNFSVSMTGVGILYALFALVIWREHKIMPVEYLLPTLARPPSSAKVDKI